MNKILSKKDKTIQWGIKDKATVKRFKSNLVNKPNGCIEYDGAFWDSRELYRIFPIYKTIRDHGFSVGATAVKAHRFAYALHYGFDKLPIAGKFSADSKVINHKCFNKSCVNPKHLNILTSRENLLEKNKKPV